MVLTAIDVIIFACDSSLCIQTLFILLYLIQIQKFKKIQIQKFKIQIQKKPHQQWFSGLYFHDQVRRQPDFVTLPSVTNTIVTSERSLYMRRKCRTILS